MYAIIDIEASGSSENSIIEIAIFRYDGLEIVDQFFSLVHTDNEIHSYVQRLTGITNKMLNRAPKFHELAKRIIEITENCILVGHGVKFDYTILKNTFKNLGYNYEKVTLDTVTLSKELILKEESYSLGKLCKSVGIPLSDRHRASGDARATVDLFKLLLNKDKERIILKKHCIERESDLKNRLNNIVNKLPAEVGVFYFLNKEKEILFSMVSNNIFNSVQKILFSKDSKITHKILKEIWFVEFQKTHNEIIALLINQTKPNDSFKRESSFSIQDLFTYGVYKNKNSLYIEDLKNKRPIIVFNDFKKAEDFVNKVATETSIQKGINKVFPNASMLIVGKNMLGKEKFFIKIEKNRIIGYGFFSHNRQILNPENLNKIIIEVLHDNYIFSIIRNYLYNSRFQKVIIL